MIIISHRGFWKKSPEKNSFEAFERSLEKGFGIETDVRDYEGELVISHDIPKKGCEPFSRLLKLYQKFPKAAPLAINIKSDGLHSPLLESLSAHQFNRYFIFDTTVPDGLNYIRKGMCTFTRQSEYELVPCYYKESSGVWLDEFFSPWINEETILEHLHNRKQLCIVSPELHGRPHLERWKKYRTWDKSLRNRVMLCTDFPDQAEEFFA
jgi:hypothetical protein